MNWNDWKENARKILAHPPEGKFEDRSFTTGSGGSPKNDVGVAEVHRDDSRAYRTTRNGWAYRGEVVVRCRDTGTLDAKGRAVFEDEGCVLFVYDYQNGSVENFDRGWLIPPAV